MSVVRPANSQLATPSDITPLYYWSIKPLFLTERKLAAVLITHLTLVVSQPLPSSTIKIFQRRCRD
jgi:hypothetical protein